MQNIFILIIIALSFHSYAQAPDTMWTKTYGGIRDDKGRSVQQTIDGGYIIAGSTDSFGAGEDDVWLIKTDALGDSLWTKTYGGSESDFGYSIQQTTDGGYIITGVTSSFGVEERDIWLIKTNNSGDTLWTKTFGRNSDDYGESVYQTTDGGYIIAGSTYLAGNNGFDVWLIKTDSFGDTLWTKTYGGSEFDFGYSTKQTEDGGYIVTGGTHSYGFGDLNVWLIKTNAFGDTLWTKTFGGLSVDVGHSVEQTTDGGYIIAGYTYTTSGGSDVYLIKTDFWGNTLWTKTIGGDDLEIGVSVQQTSDEGYIVAGSVEYPSWQSALLLIKTNPEGDTLWTKTVGEISNGNFGFSAQQTFDGDYIVAGETNFYLPPFYNDLILVKISSGVTKSEPTANTLPLDFYLHQNYPNPFNPSTTIQYQVPELRFVTLKVYDVLGNEVAILVNEEKAIDTYEITWYAEGLPSGIYFYKLRAGNFVEIKKMVLMK